MHHFWIKKKHELINFLGKAIKICFGGNFGLFLQNMDFSKKIGSISFRPLKSSDFMENFKKVFELLFRKKLIIDLLTYLPTDLLAKALLSFPFRLKMESKNYEAPTTKLIKIFSVGIPYTQLFDISSIKAIELSQKITLKNNEFTRYITSSVPEHILLNVIDGFVATINVYVKAKKSVLPFNCL